jgi:hypothetical protein
MRSSSSATQPSTPLWINSDPTIPAEEGQPLRTSLNRRLHICAGQPIGQRALRLSSGARRLPDHLEVFSSQEQNGAPIRSFQLPSARIVIDPDGAQLQQPLLKRSEGVLIER